MSLRRWDKSKLPTGQWTFNKDAPQAQGLIAWYPMAEGGGLWLPDKAGSLHFSALGTAPPRTLDRWGAPALNCVAASSHSLEVSTSQLASLPLSLASWVKITGSTGRIALCVATNGGNARVQLQIQAGRTVAAAVADSGGVGANSDTPAAGADGEWSHAVAVFASNTSRSSYINGGNVSTNTTNIVTSGMDRLLISGRRNSSGVAAYLDYPIGESAVWGIALSEDIVQRLADPGKRFELWYPLRSKKWISVGGAGVTGAIAATNANDTAVLSGTTAVTGAIARTNANDTAAFSGTTAVVGAIARTNANDTSAFSGSPVANGAIAATNADDTAAFSGSVGNAVSGSIAATNANDTAAFAGSTTVVGAIAATNQGDTAALSGTTAVKGAIAATNADDTASFSGVAGAITGSINATNANDTAVFAGTAANPQQEQPAGGYYPPPRTRKQLRDARIKFGVITEEIKEAAEKVAETAIEKAQDKDPIEYFQSRRKFFDNQLKTELATFLEPPEWVDSFSEQIQIQIERAILQKQEDDEEDDLMLLLY